MPEELDDLINRVKQKHLGEEPAEPPKKSGSIRNLLVKSGNVAGDFIVSHKKFIGIGVLAAVLVAALLVFLTKDYLTKRQNYPERNVLFRSTNVTYIAGGSGGKNAKNVDRSSETQVYEGGVASKVGTYLFMTTRESRDDIEYFNMDNSQKIRIASATRKPEVVQAGLRISGSLNFKEQLAEIIGSGSSKLLQSYNVYKFVPERAHREIEVTMIRRADGSTTLDNRMTEFRSFGLGWLWGKEFRAGTALENYLDTPANATSIAQFYQQITSLDSPQNVEPKKREQLIHEAMRLSEAIPARPIYRTYEDGIVDVLPQESTIYLAHAPGFFERFRDALLGASQHIRLRVENFWDVFPGSYPLLRAWHLGEGDNVVYPFDKFNNGGYRITDKYGALAEVEIQDFFLFYGQDVVYHYYFDLNGDGKLDRATELIGSVLCRATHDEQVNLRQLIGEGTPKADVTVTLHYSFMSPDTDLKKGMEYFKLCGDIESLMPDQINRGYGKHSMLGYINEQRSDILLFEDLTVENMSRSLTQESTLVAGQDIVNALIAAKRPYAQHIAEAYGIADQFAGRFQPSNLLRERRDWSVLLTLAAMIAAIGGYGVYRRKKGNYKEKR